MLMLVPPVEWEFGFPPTIWLVIGWKHVNWCSFHWFISFDGKNCFHQINGLISYWNHWIDSYWVGLCLIHYMCPKNTVLSTLVLLLPWNEFDWFLLFSWWTESKWIEVHSLIHFSWLLTCFLEFNEQMIVDIFTYWIDSPYKRISMNELFIIH